MRPRLGRALMVMAAATAATMTRAATVAVTITGLSETGYELDVSGIRKNGRLGAAPGPATIRDLVDVGRVDRVTASVTFMSGNGVLAVCPEVQIKLDGAQPACEPSFILTGEQAGLGRYACRSRCEPRKQGEKTRGGGEDEGDEDWVYALAPRAPAPILDGWAQAGGGNWASQSFYTSAMSSAQEARIYFPARDAR